MERVSKIFQSLEIQFGVKIHAKMEADVKAAHPSGSRKNHVQSDCPNIGRRSAGSWHADNGGEDFHHYTFHKPDLKATMLGLGTRSASGASSSKHDLSNGSNLYRYRNIG